MSSVINREVIVYVHRRYVIETIAWQKEKKTVNFDSFQYISIRKYDTVFELFRCFRYNASIWVYKINV